MSILLISHEFVTDINDVTSWLYVVRDFFAKGSKWDRGGPENDK